MLFVCLLHVLIVCGKVPTLTIGYQATVSHSPQAISVRSWPASIFYFHPSPATLYPLFFSILSMVCFHFLFSPLSCYFVSIIFLHLIPGPPSLFYFHPVSCYFISKACLPFLFSLLSCCIVSIIFLHLEYFIPLSKGQSRRDSWKLIGVQQMLSRVLTMLSTTQQNIT